MIDDWETPPENSLCSGEDAECEFCGRSVIGRFGGVPSNECPSCRADWKREVAGGMVEVA